MSLAERREGAADWRPSSFLMRKIAGWADKLVAGRLTLVFPDGHKHHANGTLPGPSATIKLNNARPVWKMLISGANGFAESYRDGDWESPNLSDLFELSIVNEQQLWTVMEPVKLFGWLDRLRHVAKSNSRTGAKRNIAFHYDLGNAFYQQWLDATMTYSSALYATPDMSLKDAQEAKYRRILQELEIGPDDHILEIGCGWGGFAEMAIKTTGCRVTGLTLSKEQAAYARQRLEDANLSDRAEIRLQDYRDTKGRFSKIVSIEMFEAVGEAHWPTYFAQVRDLMEANGKAIVQVITIDEDIFELYRRSADFIQTYIFPGGMLPSVPVFEDAARKAKLEVGTKLHFGLDYERTVLEWDRRFKEGWANIKPLGFDEKFYRLWRYYLHYCAAGFRSKRLDVVQFTLSR